MDVLALGESLTGEFGLDAESVGTEVVTLGLEQVGGKVLGAVTIIEAEGSGESGCGDTPESSLADHVAPAVLGIVNGVLEEFVEKEVFEVGVVAVSVGDILEEDGTDNATTAPHESDGGLVELPVVFLGGLVERLVSVTV